MALGIHSLTIDCADPRRLAEFWTAVLDYKLSDDSTEEEVLITDPAGHHDDLLFIRVPEGKAVKNRLHLDLIPTTTQAEEVERLLKLGAQRAPDFKDVGGIYWTVLQDPEGNEFCVVRSQQERKQ